MRTKVIIIKNLIGVTPFFQMKKNDFLNKVVKENIRPNVWTIYDDFGK